MLNSDILLLLKVFINICGVYGYVYTIYDFLVKFCVEYMKVRLVLKILCRIVRMVCYAWLGKNFIENLVFFLYECSRNRSEGNRSIINHLCPNFIRIDHYSHSNYLETLVTINCLELLFVYN